MARHRSGFPMDKPLAIGIPHKRDALHPVVVHPFGHV